MAAAPLTIKLRCKSWVQLKSIYTRDLRRGAIFLKTGNPPPLGARIRIDLSLPSDSLIVLNGGVSQHVPTGGLGGRGPGIDIELDTVPQSAMWLIETALKSAAAKDREVDEPTRRREAMLQPPMEPVHTATMEDDADVADAEVELVAALRDEHESLARLNPFQVLGVAYETTDAEVRAAFGQLTRKYHPDRFARYQSREARQHASEIFILVRDAYRKLGNEKARAQTLRVLQSKRATPTRGTRTPTPRPATPSRRPEAPVRAGPAAKPAFTPSLPTSAPPPELGDIFGDTPELSSHIAAAPVSVASDRRATLPTYSDAVQLLETGDHDRALQIYQRAARGDPGDRVARAGVELAEGLQALAQRDRLEAAQRFEAVLELDPSNERAARELAEMRRVATNERKGLLARLLGKKE